MKKFKKVITYIAAAVFFLCASGAEYASREQIILCVISAMWLLIVSVTNGKAGGEECGRKKKITYDVYEKGREEFSDAVYTYCRRGFESGFKAAMTLKCDEKENTAR